MEKLLEEWRKFLVEGVVNTKEELIAIVSSNTNLKKSIDEPKGTGTKTFGRVKRQVVTFDYGEWPNLINPADDMGWDFILASKSNINDEDLLPVGVLSYIGDRDLWDSNGVEMPKNVAGNHKIILSRGGKISQEEKSHLSDYFKDMWQFKKLKWL